MYNKTWKKKVLYTVNALGIDTPIADTRTIKKLIYNYGKRGTTYLVEEFIEDTGEIINKYLYKYTENGPIFTSKIFDKWKEMKEAARLGQLDLLF